MWKECLDIGLMHIRPMIRVLFPDVKVECLGDFMSASAARGQRRMMSIEMWCYKACHMTIYDIIDIACYIKGAI